MDLKNLKKLTTYSELRSMLKRRQRDYVFAADALGDTTTSGELLAATAVMLGVMRESLDKYEADDTPVAVVVGHMLNSAGQALQSGLDQLPSFIAFSEAHSFAEGYVSRAQQLASELTPEQFEHVFDSRNGSKIAADGTVPVLKPQQVIAQPNVAEIIARLAAQDKTQDTSEDEGK